MKLVREYPSVADAYIDKGMLETNGIECVISNNAMSEVFPAPDSGTGRVQLYVPDDKYNDARSLLMGDIE